MTTAAAPARTGVHILPVRHHGPGSARGVRRELDRIRPDAVLIEGPADADPLTALVSEPGMTPPVALLAYASDAPGTASFWPFAVFSPEWQALLWASENQVPVRFCDLPSGVVLAARQKELAAQQESTQAPADGTDETSETAEPDPVRTDPIALLAEAGGYDDPERWWDDLVESRDQEYAFEAITEAMRAVRDDAPPEPEREAVREAHMRRAIRETSRTAETVAVVCGAWHAPALSQPFPSATSDNALLTGLPKLKTTMTWVPWAHSRLSVASGYRAGTISPGWYHHLFTAPDQVVERWLLSVAHTLRGKDIGASPAHVIEAARLANELGALRGRPLPGLAEVTDATRSVLCNGDEVLLAMVQQQVVIGEALGSVPESAPMVPLESDLRATAKSLRLPIEVLQRDLTLDLRKPNDLAKSQLLHRLSVLDIPWGTPVAARGQGTFKEAWSLAWQPEFAVDIAAASVWGTTVRGAAGARALERAAAATTLSVVTDTVQAVLLADLPETTTALLDILRDRAAVDLDVTHLMAALPSLVAAVRYGDVRGTDTEALTTVATSLLVRVRVGLPVAVTGLGPDAVAELRPLIDGVQAATALLPQAERDEWLQVIGSLAERDDLDPGLVGRFTRIALDSDVLTSDEAGIRLGRALSAGAEVAAKARWLDGFLSGDGQLLIHDTGLLAVVDRWVVALTAEQFLEVVAVLRRSFGAFEPAVRRGIGEQVNRLGTATPQPGAESSSPAVDLGRAGPVIDAIADLLGLPA